MRNVSYITKNGTVYTSYEKATTEDRYAKIILSADYDAEASPKKDATKFGAYTGKLAEGWKEPFHRI